MEVTAASERPTSQGHEDKLRSQDRMPRQVPPAVTCACTASAQRSEVPAVLDWIDRHAVRLGRRDRCAGGRGRPHAGGRRRSRRSTCRDSIAPRWTAMRCAARRPPARANTIPLAFPVLGQAMPGQPFDGDRPARRGGAHHDRRAGARRASTRWCRPSTRRETAGRDRDHPARRAGPARRASRRGHPAKARRRWRAGRRLRPQDVGLRRVAGPRQRDASCGSRGCASSSPATK